METTQADSVIAEVRAVRDGIAAQSNYDVGAIFRADPRDAGRVRARVRQDPARRIVDGSNESLAV